MNTCSPDQAQAILRFAASNGRHWKSKLLSAWTSGRDERLPDSGLLRQVRNELGPVWLSQVSLKGLSHV